MTIPNGTLIMRGAVITTSYHPQRSDKAHVQKEASGGWWWVQGLVWNVCVGAHCQGASISKNSSRKVCAETLACIPNTHAQGSISVLYMIKYIYTFICLMLFMQRKVFIYHFGEICICCANQSIVIPISYVPKVFPTILSTKGGNEGNHTFQVKQKAPIQHHNF